MVCPVVGTTVLPYQPTQSLEIGVQSLVWCLTKPGICVAESLKVLSRSELRQMSGVYLYVVNDSY